MTKGEAISTLSIARKLDTTAIEDLVDHRSSLLGLSGVSGDMQALHDAAASNRESLLLADPEHTQDRTCRLHELGIRIVIDVFGAGYSSLACLKRFPAQAMKIDHLFVQGLPDDRDATIAQAVISMAHGLGAQVDTEGVETPCSARVPALPWLQRSGGISADSLPACGAEEPARWQATVARWSCACTASPPGTSMANISL